MYSAELELAREVVLHASAAARALQGRALVVQKDDESAISSGGYDPLQDGANPVTVADFTVQCLVLSALHEAFPGDRFIAEETSAQLLASGEATVAATLAAVRAAAAEASPAAGPAAGGSEGPHLGFEGLETLEGVCAALDLGATGLSEGWSKAHRTWVLDPIDGTKGFVRGDQFAVALALLDQGSPVLGILGCPNLAPPDEAAAQGREPGAAANKRRGAERPTGCVKDDDEAGSLFWAVKGHGAYLENLGVGGEASPRGGARRISVGQQRSYRSVVRLEAFEAAHSNFGAAQAVARALDLGGDREPVRMDGQVQLLWDGDTSFHTEVGSTLLVLFCLVEYPGNLFFRLAFVGCAGQVRANCVRRRGGLALRPPSAAAAGLRRVHLGPRRGRGHRRGGGRACDGPRRSAFELQRNGRRLRRRRKAEPGRARGCGLERR